MGDAVPQPEINTAYFKYSEQEFIGNIANEFDGGLILFLSVMLMFYFYSRSFKSE
ncbi:MAG: hypothetical protein CM15mP32_4910 [Flavobacteriaceae bacterium]|nr:MAG: hypothetical protein CM15mP32_4910 [Flavobacteriaceae bacterium]